MDVQTLFFAAYRDLLETSALDVEVPEGTTVGDLVEQLRARGGAFEELPPDPAVAVNRAYAGPERRLEPGDEVAFIPPVAGG